MIILKAVIQYTITNGCEATWVERTITPQAEVPAVVDDHGNVVTPAIPATPGKDAYTPDPIITDVQVKCHSYGGTQMDMFRADAAAFGTPLDDYEDMIADIESKIVPYVPPPPVVPTSVNMWRARVVLHRAGLLDAVVASIDAMPEPDRTEAKIVWEFAPEVDRYFGFVPQVAAALGLIDAQIDALFITASQL